MVRNYFKISLSIYSYSISIYYISKLDYHEVRAESGLRIGVILEMRIVKGRNKEIVALGIGDSEMK